MTATTSSFRFQTLARVLLPLLAISTTLVQGQTPSQVPLLSKPGVAVAPNVMLTLDDSGSMAFRHMPETVFAGGTYATKNPVGSGSVLWDQTDNFQIGANMYLAPNGAIPGVMGPPAYAPGAPTDTYYVLRAMRSSETNTVFYNPEIRYQPWMTADGVTRLPNSPVDKAYLNPLVRTGAAGTIIDLTRILPNGTFNAGSFVAGFTYTIVTPGNTSFTSIGAANNNAGTIFVATGPGAAGTTGTARTGTTVGWCFVRTNGGCGYQGQPFLHDPGVYFKLKLNVAAGSFVKGKRYTIATVGTTDFVALGATANTVGFKFTATGAGTGTGVAHEDLETASNYDAFSINVAPAGSFVVGAQYKIASTGNTPFTSIGAVNNVVGTVFTATGVGTGTGTAVQIAFTKYPNRLDCAGSTCTQADERQNFANWYTYYRNRNLLARGGLMEAFALEAAPVGAGNFVAGSSYAITSLGSPNPTDFKSIGASANTVDTIFTATGVGSGDGTARAIAMRLGFGRINSGGGTIDGQSSKVIEGDTKYGAGGVTGTAGGVRDFNRARKDNLFKWLEDLPASGGTPLVGALEANGAYFSRKDKQGPWTDNPASNSNDITKNKTCRRSYTFLTTDGYWTTAGTAGNSDNEDGDLIESPPQLPKPAPRKVQYPAFKYKPVAPYKDDWSNTLADTAMKYWKKDLQTDMENQVPPVGGNESFWQNMTTFTIGLGVRGSLNPETDLQALIKGDKSWPQAKATGTFENVDDLWHAAINSRGQYFSVKDPQELALAIRTALARATGDKGSTAGVAVASSTSISNNRKYKLDYDPGNWNGQITALGPNPSTDPLKKGKLDTEVWTATKRNPDANWESRNIVTFDSAPSTWAATEFKPTSISSGGMAAMGPVAAANPAAFVNFLRGEHTNEGASKLYRNRLDPAGQPFILGDIVNSNPALIWNNFDGFYTDPAFGGVDSDNVHAYTKFKKFKKGRTPVLFAGSNDGMLHAYQDSLSVDPVLTTDGKEVFAYVPRAVYGNLNKLADKNYGTTAALPHQYFVDGPLAEADAYVRAPGATSPSWRNYLMGTLGAGGRAVFAIDATDTPDLKANAVRWELTSAEDPDMGHVLSNVRIGVLPTGRWVAVFGNGFGSTGGTAGASRAVLFVVDLEQYASTDAATRKGAIHKTVLDKTPGNGLGGVTLIPDIETGRTMTIYAGDLKGNMWKLNYGVPNEIPDPDSPVFQIDGGKPFFKATDKDGTPQPITASPGVFRGPSSQKYKGYQIVFGTGKLFSTADASDSSPQTIYSVWDKSAGPKPLTEAVPRPMNRLDNLVARKLTEVKGTGGADGVTFYSLTGDAVDYNSAAQRGFYIDVQQANPGGRVVYPVQVLGFNTALVSAVAPVQGTPAACEASAGLGLNMLFSVDTGINSATPSFDTNGDGKIDSGDQTVAGYSTKADGSDAAVSSQGLNDTPGNDVGGGAKVGECTGKRCMESKCVKSTKCNASQCLVTVENSTGSQDTCVKEFPAGTRIWRRIINPPVH